MSRSNVINMLERQTYGMRQVDDLLGLHPGTASRWIDGYERSGKVYDPVIREERTGDPLVTWGEFVETRLLAEYRQEGVPLARLRPAIQVLRDELGTQYPLAMAHTWLSVEGKELVADAQERGRTPDRLRLVVRSRQSILGWTRPAQRFERAVEWTDDSALAEVRRIRPADGFRRVVLDPLVAFGSPTVSGIRTDVLAELVRAGEPVDAVAEAYAVTIKDVVEATRFESMVAA